MWFLPKSRGNQKSCTMVAIEELHQFAARHTKLLYNIRSSIVSGLIFRRENEWNPGH